MDPGYWIISYSCFFPPNSHWNVSTLTVLVVDSCWFNWSCGQNSLMHHKPRSQCKVPWNGRFGNQSECDRRRCTNTHTHKKHTSNAMTQLVLAGCPAGYNHIQFRSAYKSIRFIRALIVRQCVCVCVLCARWHSKRSIKFIPMNRTIKIITI